MRRARGHRRCAHVHVSPSATRAFAGAFAGAHVDLRLPNGLTRQYSLCGDPDEDAVYTIAVKREDGGRGGSRWIHENVRLGSTVPVSAPRNNIPLAAEAQRHVFIAGGIGITPMLPMARQLARRGVSFHLHYCKARRSYLN